MRCLLNYAPDPDERLCLLLVSKSGVCIVVPSFNAEEMAANTDIKLYRWSDDMGPQTALKQALMESSPIEKLAFDGGMRADFLLPILAATEPQETISIEALLTPIRACKSDDEIVVLGQSASLADLAMQAAVRACQPGASEIDVAWAAETAFRRNGTERVTFTLVASGRNGAYPHHNSSKRKLQDGDAIIIDIGASLNGYQSDITRMVFLGNPPEQINLAYAAVLEANERGKTSVKPGVAAQEIDQITRGILEKAGMESFSSITQVMAWE